MWPDVWKRDLASARKCRACAAILLVGAALFGLAECSTGQANEEREFSLEEFYDIKRSVMRTGMDISKAKKASAVLEQAREEGKKLHGSLPKAPTFYGQDHYEQTIDEKGHETWSHVGRPDELAYDMFFKTPSKYNGTFLEVGAADGVRSSNTLFFEESLGWSGLLIEGATENFLQLFADNRRKRSVKTFSAICSGRGSTKFVGDGLAAGAVEDMTRNHIESYARHFKSLRLYDVPCDTLGALVRRAKLPRVIDLVSVDIEGGEMRALETFDWAAHSVRVLVLEPGRSCFRSSENVCAALLRKHGMCLVARRAVNEFWVGDRALKRAYCPEP